MSLVREVSPGGEGGWRENYLPLGRLDYGWVGGRDSGSGLLERAAPRLSVEAGARGSCERRLAGFFVLNASIAMPRADNPHLLSDQPMRLSSIDFARRAKRGGTLGASAIAFRVI